MITIMGTGVKVRKESIISGCRQYGLELLRWNKLDNGIRKAFLEKREHQVSKAGDDIWCVVRDTRGGFEIRCDV